MENLVSKFNIDLVEIDDKIEITGGISPAKLDLSRKLHRCAHVLDKQPALMSQFIDYLDKVYQQDHAPKIIAPRDELKVKSITPSIIQEL